MSQARARTSCVAGGTCSQRLSVNVIYDDVWTDKDEARTAVRFERRLELSDEGHRFFDLVRWGVAAPVLNAYLSYERQQVPASPFVGATFTAGVNEHLPIPQREIDVLGQDILQQNPGY